MINACEMANSLSNLIIRPAKPDDCNEICRLIKELAVFEKLEDQFKMTAEVLRKDCFGDRPLCYCIVAEQKDHALLVGYALYFSIYSTWEGASLHLEDLYVTPALRGRGIGTEMWKHVTKELAVFEKLEDQFKMTAEVLRKDCFGDRPLCYCIVAEQKDHALLVGYALYFSIYSTWEGASLHLEDLYVTPALRGRGIGTEMWKHVTKHALEIGCSRLQLTVLGWNTKAKDLYMRHGFMDLTESEGWHLLRMTRNSMEEFVRK